MSIISFRVTGDDGKALAEEMMAEMRTRAPAPMTRAAEAIAKTARRLAGRPAAGRTSSKPGEPPLMRTGAFLKTIKSGKIRKWARGNVRRVRYGSNAPFATVLEYGNSHSAARPLFRPAETLARAEVDRILDEI